MENLSVRHLEQDRFSISVRGHILYVDQPEGAGGTDTPPTPTELFVAGLASCVAFYARRYLARHGIATDGLAVSTDFETGGRPNRVTRITISVQPPAGLPQERRAGFLAVASHCTVHNTLADPPAIAITLDDRVAAH